MNAMAIGRPSLLLLALLHPVAALRAHAIRRHISRRTSLPTMSDADKIYKRAEFWDPETCTLLDIANVLGRWESSSEWAERTAFSVAKERRKENMALSATKERYDMAQRMGVVERVALQQNAAKLRFTNERLAASFDKSVKEMNAMPVSKAAIDVVFDALAESKSGLLKPEVVDERRGRFFAADGSIDEGAFSAGLYRSRAVVLFSWLFFGKGRIYGFAVFIKLCIDSLDLRERLGELGPYVDYLLFAGAFVAAVLGVRNQAEVVASTSNYETVSREEAEAATVGQKSEGAYSTAFEKWTAKGKIPSEDQPEAKWKTSGESGDTVPSGTPTWVPPLVMVAGILSLNVLGGN
mmetsp:Transcript_44233/g.116240  ORF Transcript_44233/g.116240 Transcript_44233/m.116240 type:complete len:351 (-) Transcript_44233:198-1250(-)